MIGYGRHSLSFGFAHCEEEKIMELDSPLQMVFVCHGEHVQGVSSFAFFGSWECEWRLFMVVTS
jgi:hypothetical protein